MKNKFAICLLAVAALASSAAAAPITFTVSMLGAGTLNGVNFTATNVSFTFTSDTSAITTAGAGIFTTPLGIPGTFDIQGFASGIVTEAGLHVFDNQNTSRGGFSAGSGDFINIPDAVFGAYDLQSNFTSPGDTPNFLDPTGYATDGGQLIVTSARNAVLSAVVTPEPGTFAFLGGGIALMVAGYRRRTR